MKIGVDLDGVLAITDAAMIRDFQTRGLCRGKTPEDITHYYWEECFDGVTGELIAEVLNRPGFYQELRPCPYLLDAVCKLGEMGHEIHIVTARKGPPHVKEETREWLLQHNVPFHHLEIEEAHGKHEYAKHHGLTLFVEDRFDTANRIAAQRVPVLLVEAPYNTPREFGRGELHENVKRLPRHELAGSMIILGAMTANLAAAAEAASR